MTRKVALYLGFWREEGLAETVYVAHVHLDAGVGEAQLVEAGGVVPWADVALAREWRYGDGVLQLRLGEIVADASVYVTLGGEGGRGLGGRGRHRKRDRKRE